MVLVEGGVERADVYRFTDSSLEPSRVLIEDFTIGEFVTSGSEVLEDRRVDILCVVSVADTIRPSRLAYVVLLTVITAHMVDRTTNVFYRILVLRRTKELPDGVGGHSMRYDSMLAELPHKDV